jgi:H+/Cl- antiporter ClcA
MRNATMPVGDAYDRSRTYPEQVPLPWWLVVVAFIGLIVVGVLAVPLLLAFAFIDCIAQRGEP